MGKVVEFPVRVAGARKMENEALRRMYAVWLQLRRGAVRAALDDFPATRLRGLMSWTGMTTPIGEGAARDMRWRFAGSALCRLAGAELGGEAPFAGCASFERDTLRRLLAGAARRDQPAMARLRLPLSGMMDPLRLEMLVLPLAAREPREGTCVMTIMQPLEHASPHAREMPWRMEGALASLRIAGLWMLREPRGRDGARLPLAAGGGQVLPFRTQAQPRHA